MSRIKTGTGWLFAIAVVLFVVAVAVLGGTARSVLETVAGFTLIAACLRAVVLAVRDDEVSSSTIRGPAGRTLGIMGADSRHAQRMRRRAREEAAKPGPERRPPAS
jgi:purine-cytosine permease-like protein